jgi:hypothetical protein
MSEIVYLLWSNKHGAWWRPDGRGYTDSIEEAGDYTEAEAVARVKQSALCGDRNKVTLMVAAPHNWSPRLPEVYVAAGPGPLVDVLAEHFAKVTGHDPRSS